MDFYDVMARRRTTRRFTIEPVPRETVERILARPSAWLRTFFHEQEGLPVTLFLTDAPHLVCVFGEKDSPCAMSRS